MSGAVPSQEETPPMMPAEEKCFANDAFTTFLEGSGNQEQGF